MKLRVTDDGFGFVHVQSAGQRHADFLTTPLQTDVFGGLPRRWDEGVTIPFVCVSSSVFRILGCYELVGHDGEAGLRQLVKTLTGSAGYPCVHEDWYARGFCRRSC